MLTPNPYQRENVSESEPLPTTRSRSLILAYVSGGIALLIGSGVALSQRKFANLFSEFGVETSLITWIACSSVLPILLFSIAVISLVIGHCFLSIANRMNGLLVVCSIILLFLYLWGVLSPFSQLTHGA